MAGVHKWAPAGVGAQMKSYPAVYILAWLVAKHVKKANGRELLMKNAVIGVKTADEKTSRVYSEVRAV
jgi:hypothetical protein